MPADKVDFEQAQEIHELLCAVADQGSKEEAMSCLAMSRLTREALGEDRNFNEFLFRCAIAVQFGPVEAMPSEGARAGDAPTWGDDTLSQEDKETAQRIDAMTKRYADCHDEGPIELAPENKDDENQGMT